MRLITVLTNEFEVSIKPLIERRLAALGSSAIPVRQNGADGRSVTVGIGDPSELSALASALSEVMLLDLRHFIIADMVEQLPFSLREKERILIRALENTEEYEGIEKASEELAAFLRENDRLIFEGYLRFRLRSETESWSVVVDAVAEQQLICDEFAELTECLGLFPAALSGCGTREVTVILNPDGSCTLCGPKENSGEFRIDCAPGNDEGVLSLLRGLSPGKLTIYDLSFGRCGELRRGIEQLFGGRLDPSKEE